MSSLVVQVCTVDEIKPHANADRLELATIKGWQCVVVRGEYAAGEPVVYFPPETVLPQEWTDRFGVTPYCSLVKPASPSYVEGQPAYRIRCARLRGEPSFGLVVSQDHLPAALRVVGQDVAEAFGATKYEPPVKFGIEDAMREHPLFARYTDVESLRDFPDAIPQRERVVATEKVHGTNVRVASLEGTLVAGSHRLQRRQPEDPARSRYWFPLSLAGVEQLLVELGKEHQQVILYGEVYGRGIQNLTYGRKGLAFAAFDLLVDGRFLDYEPFLGICARFGVPVVPELGRFAYDSHQLSLVEQLATGPSSYGGNIKEGLVVRPLIEQTHPKLGRLVLKWISNDYLLNKQEEFTDA